jgi:alkanesulfonate monooxygenase SsuD/methylene tetrahydromethanopterin reductase-like flavin-dependent oxidoreductase (luciferase family)
MSPRAFAARTVMGTPEELAAALREHVAAGVNYFIVSFRDAEEIEPLRLFAREVMPRVRNLNMSF